ncbi:kelch-like protein 7 [Anopheles funestus]|uniref:BTB domain-containing protein n=1 Tax=Anopheles funestus TaxID=62324 RepID=A0A182RHU2_ANOFN|nr:kelch-like protein 7 [Anopheles funestus]
MATTKTEGTIAAMLGRNLSYGSDDTMSSRLESMVNNEFCSDVTFIVGASKKRIYAHKLLLVMASEYFYVMFFGNFVEANRNEVTLEDVDPDVFLVILRYIYCLKVDITFDNLRDIFDCSQKYMLTDLHHQLGCFLRDQVEETTALSIFNINRYYAYPMVDESCLELIRNNPLYYFNHVDFATIHRESLFKIFSSWAINCTDDQLSSALDIWEEANREEDTQELRMIVKLNKRYHNCLKLIVFGQNMNDVFVEPADDLNLGVMSDMPLSLYGLGVYLLSKANVISVELKIYEEDTEISSDVFECPNPCISTVHVADLFFEEVVMVPRKNYRISINMSPPCKQVLLREPRTYHEKIRLVIMYPPGDRKPIGIAHVYCKERSREPKKK